MSQVSPGWYPDPSGRFAQRYHDGTRWTEHVADAGGQRSVDNPEGQAAPAANPYGGEQQASGQSWGAQGGYEQRPQRPSSRAARGGRPRAVSRGYGGQRRRPGLRPAGLRPAVERPGVARAGRPARRAARGGRPRAASSRATGSRATASTGYGQQGYGQQPGGFGQPAYGYGTSSSGGFTPTIGLIVGGVGALFVLLSLFVLDFLKVERGRHLRRRPAGRRQRRGRSGAARPVLEPRSHPRPARHRGGDPRHPEAAADPAAQQHPQPADHRGGGVRCVRAVAPAGDVRQARGAGWVRHRDLDLAGHRGLARPDRLDRAWRPASSCPSRSATSADGAPTAATGPRAAHVAGGALPRPGHRSGLTGGCGRRHTVGYRP